MYLCIYADNPTSMTDGRKIRGNRTRDRILGPGVPLATVKGLEGFSLSDLSEVSGVSKASIATLFGPKLQLQLAITERARQVLIERVFRVVYAEPSGLPRLERLGSAWLDYLVDPSLVGGCFFAAASFELDARPGPLHDVIQADMNLWLRGIEEMIADGQENGEIRRDRSVRDFAFTFFSLGITSNLMIQLGSMPRPAEQARRVWRGHLKMLQPSRGDDE